MKVNVMAWALVGLIGASAAQAAVVYDSGGFEPTAGFVAAASLKSQDEAHGAWKQDAGTSTATVQTNNDAAGVQSVLVQQISGATGNTRWWVGTPPLSSITPTPESAIENIDADISVSIPADLNTHGPYFGLEAFDDAGTTPGTSNLIGGVLIDAAQGTVLYYDGSSGLPVATTKSVSESYHHFTLSTDFADKTYSIYVDGALVHTEPFVTKVSTGLGLAPIVTLDATNTSDTGSAYFDNYAVSETQSVPEPASLAALASGGALLLARRRRGR